MISISIQSKHVKKYLIKMQTMHTVQNFLICWMDWFRIRLNSDRQFFLEIRKYEDKYRAHF
jgi:hypothetical protein